MKPGSAWSRIRQLHSWVLEDPFDMKVYLKRRNSHGNPTLHWTSWQRRPDKGHLPFLMAGGALDAGHQAGIVLLGDAVVLMNSAVADSVQGVGFPALKDVMAKVIAAKVPIYI